MRIDDGQDGYDRVVDAFQHNAIAHYARVLIANPLIEFLPNLVLLVQLTCNKFDSMFVKEQWESIELYVCERCGGSLNWPCFRWG